METSKITKIILKFSKPSKDMDVVYMNKLLERRISHGMDYFGKDKNLKSYFFFWEKIYIQNKYWKFFSRIFFFKNATKYCKIFSGNYFPKNILRQNKHARLSYSLSPLPIPWLLPPSPLDWVMYNVSFTEFFL